MDCRICAQQIQEFFPVKEMIFGFSEEFVYGACPSCGCVQIKDIPGDLGKFYPSDYYSLRAPTNAIPVFPPFKRFLLQKRDLHYFKVRRSLAGAVLNLWAPGQVSSQFLPYQFLWNELWRRPNARIHDVGCGTGSLLRYFSAFGFQNLSGSDPFIASGIRETNLRIEKKEWNMIEEKFEAVMMNHVLEHCLDPYDFLRTAYRNLTNDGTVLVRVPVADSSGFEKYREHWVGMEAPRHLHLFTQKSFRSLARRCGFEVTRVEYDAVGWHYMVSEGYKQGVLLKDQDHQKMFTPAEQKQYEEEAERANRSGKGDTCAFYLKKRTA